MFEVVFSKYSNQRSSKYQIRTDILEDELGNRRINKKAMTMEAQHHIQHIYDSYNALSQFYDNNLINIPKCSLSKDKVELEYITGMSLAEIFDALYANKKYDDIVTLLKEYKYRIAANKSNKFIKTSEFINVFNDIDIPQDAEAIDISDIDIIFDNIIVSNNIIKDSITPDSVVLDELINATKPEHNTDTMLKECIGRAWSIIDYEWTFNFAVPINFIVYRALLFYGLRSQTRSEMIKNLDLYTVMGISDSDIEIYKQMESALSAYINEGYVHLDKFNNLIGNKRHNLTTFIDENEKRDIEVFYDYGEGYRAEEMQRIICSQDEDSQVITLKVTEGIKSIRIDPGSNKSIVTYSSMYGFDGSYYTLRPISNGVSYDGKTIIFETDDPQLIINNLKEGTTKVSFKISISSINNEITKSVLETITSVKEEIKQKDELKARTDSELAEYKTQYGYAIQQRDHLSKRLSDMQHQYEQLQTSYNIVTHSTMWRITKPGRVVLDKIKAMLKKNTYTRMACKGIKCIKNNGIKFTLRKVKQYRNSHSSKLEYLEESKLTQEDIKKQQEYKFSKDIKFSIIVPLYNTPENFLREMIDSCINQTYSNWELCLADGSDDEHKYVADIAAKYQQKDAKANSKSNSDESRIKYKKLESNGGISENTNACIKIATGDYIALFDHDDVLHPAALYEYMKVICDKNADFIYCDEDKFDDDVNRTYDPYFKPDFAPDNLRVNNYICHFTVFKKSLLDEVGMFRKEFDGSQDHDIIFRLTEKAEHIVHVPKVLYHWRVSKASVASDPYAKPYTIEAGIKAVEEHLQRVGLDATVESSPVHPNIYRLRYKIQGNPLISIIIPNKDHIIDLSRCINSIMTKSTYKNYEIIVIENNSTEDETFNYYKELEKYDNVKVVTYQTNGKFNYSAINNYGVQFASGEHFLFLNNDIEVISESWLEEMLMYSQRSDVGAVGAKLYYPNDTLQHGGVIIGIGGVAGHSHKYFPRNDYGYFAKCMMVQDYSAVTAACLMMKASIFKDINGFDETFEVAFNDVDLCMRIRKEGYLIVWTPYAELYHYESISRGAEDTPEKIKRFQGEVFRFQNRWNKELELGDPYYNANLTLEREDYSLRRRAN